MGFKGRKKPARRYLNPNTERKRIETRFKRKKKNSSYVRLYNRHLHQQSFPEAFEKACFCEWHYSCLSYHRVWVTTNPQRGRRTPKFLFTAAANKRGQVQKSRQLPQEDLLVDRWKPPEFP